MTRHRWVGWAIALVMLVSLFGPAVSGAMAQDDEVDDPSGVVVDTIEEEEELDSLDADGVDERPAVDGGAGDAGGGQAPSGAAGPPAAPEPLSEPAVLRRVVLEPIEPALPGTPEPAGQEQVEQGQAADHGLGATSGDTEPADGRVNGHSTVAPPIGAVGRRRAIWASRRRSRH